jgi:hypothetical protein
MPVILAMKEAEIGRIIVQGQLRKRFMRPSSQPKKKKRNPNWVWCVLSSQLYRKYK